VTKGRRRRVAPSSLIAGSGSQGATLKLNIIPLSWRSAMWQWAIHSLTPSERRTSSKAAVNLLSRSRIKIRCLCFCSASAIVRLRACWTTQAPSGLAVMPARYTRRRDSSMKKST
jgi:hypothetical protein